MDDQRGNYRRLVAATSLTTYLWFDTEALDAAKFYVELFPGGKMGDISYYRADTT